MNSNVIKSEIFTEKLMYESISDLIMKGLNRNSEKNFIIDGIAERQWTRRQVLDSCQNFAYYLINDCKLTKGDVVCFVGDSSDHLVIGFLGVILAGAVYTILPLVSTEYEIQSNLKTINPSLVVCDQQYYEFVRKSNTMIKNIFLIEHAQTHPHVPSIDMIIKIERQPNIALPVPSGLADIAVIVMTSGSTARPKHIVKTNANLLWTVCTVNSAPGMNAGSGEIIMVCERFNNHGVYQVLSALDIAGAQVAIIGKDVESNCNNIHAFGVTTLFMTPTQTASFLRYCATRDKHLLNSVRLFKIGGAPLPHTLYQYIRDNYSFEYLMNDYGLTETGPATSVYMRDSGQYSTVGKPCPNTEIKIIDASDNALPANTSGEICIRSGRVCAGYLHNTPEENARLFTSDGFFRTGDIGYYDSSHDFYIVSRIKDVINVYGLTIAPVELENILLTHCDVSMAAVIGIPNERSVEAPLAFVTLVKGAKVTVDELLEYVNSRVHRFKQLTGGLRVLDTFPMTHSEKINKIALKGMV